MTTALTSRSQTHELPEGEEKIDLNPHRVAYALISLNIAWLSAVTERDFGTGFWWVLDLACGLMFSLFVYSVDLSVSFSKECFQDIIGKTKYRLLWSEIQNAEMSEKQDRLVVFAGHDKRITIPLLKGNPPLRERLVQELELRNILITTTKRAAYYETKNSELSENVR